MAKDKQKKAKQKKVKEKKVSKKQYTVEDLEQRQKFMVNMAL